MRGGCRGRKSGLWRVRAPDRRLCLGRFNTPPSNRSSTSQKLYWSSCAGYVLSALALFVALVILLKSGPWRKLLIPSGDDASLPAPLVATLAMTTLRPLAPDVEAGR